jgi:hypothetical protein
MAMTSLLWLMALGRAADLWRRGVRRVEEDMVDMVEADVQKL